MPFATRIREVRKSLANRRIELIAQRRLSGELASFRSPAERAELEQILGRHSTEETRGIREILNRQDYERQWASSVIGGRPI